MTQYASILGGALALNVLALAYRCQWHIWLTARPTKEDTPRNSDAEDASIKMKRRHAQLLYKIYLPVYLLAVAADWLQGPYKYAVYSAYGYDQRAISVLFVAGFGSGMSLGSVVGGLADTVGRRRMACAYCLLYTVSCCTKHCKSFGMLLFGRILGGIATSLLFSVFDAWLIRASELRGIDASYLSESFSVANFGSSVVAILAGLIANAVVGKGADKGAESSLKPAFFSAQHQWALEEARANTVGPPLQANDPRWAAAWIYKGGGIKAFDLALIPLALCCLLAVLFWDENYGNSDISNNKPQKQQHKWQMLDGLKRASLTIWHNPAIFNLCAVTSFFEGSMYVFILLWTPAIRALDQHPEDPEYPGPPLGIIFASFMVFCMLGTSVFAISTQKGIRPSRILAVVLALSSLSCLTIALTQNDNLSYGAMLLFEGCIGAYYPAMSTVKGNVVPEEQRAAIYSVFRLPMNLVVLLNLFSHLGFHPAFLVCTAMLAIAAALQAKVIQWENDQKGSNKKANSLDEEERVELTTTSSSFPDSPLSFTE